MDTIQRQDLLTKAYYDFKNGLNRYSSYKVSNPYIGEELVQETFLKTWKYIIRGGKISTMKAFLYHVLNGLIVDKYRKHKSISLDILVENGFDPKDDDFEKIMDSLDSKRAISMISALPIKYRRLMKMKYVRNLSLEEMAQMTNQSKNTIAVQINRGLKKLKMLYEQKNV